MMSWMFRIQERHPWTFIGAFFTITALVLAVLFWLFPKGTADKALISTVVSSEGNVLDVNIPVDSLQVYYAGVDVRKSKANLRFMTVEISNTGNVDVLQNMFDQNYPWGIVIDGGRLVSSRLDTTSNDYLKDCLSPLRQCGDTILFADPIFEAGEFFRLILLIIHPDSCLPTVKVIGKIARFKSLSVIYHTDERSNVTPGLFHEPAVILLLAVVVLLLIGITLDRATHIPNMIRARRFVASVSIDPVHPLAWAVVRDLYIEFGQRNLLRLESLLSDDKRFHQKIAEIHFNWFRGMWPILMYISLRFCRRKSAIIVHTENRAIKLVTVDDGFRKNLQRAAALLARTKTDSATGGVQM